jgi:hypothetical protein
MVGLASRIPTQANSGPLEPPPAGLLLRFCARRFFAQDSPT